MISRKFANEKGSSAKRVAYVFGNGHEHKCEQVELVGGNVFGSTLEELTEELDTPCHLRQAATGKDTGKCHMHYMLSLPDGEALTRVQWNQVLEKTMGALGYTEDHKFFGMLHHDTAHQHMHILANRISMRDYKLLSESNDYEVLMSVCREIEQEHGLHIVPMPHETFGVNLTREEVEASQKSGDMAWKHKLIARVATALERTQEAGGNMLDFTKMLKQADIDVELTTDKSGKPTGISYKLEGKSISGRQLKRSRFTWQQLTKREGIHYDDSMLQELQKAVKTRDAEPEENPGPNPTTHKGLFVSKKNSTVKPKSKSFAIVVHTDRLRRTAIARLLEPSYTRGNKHYYRFGSNVKLTKKELELKIHNEQIERSINSALRLIEAILSIFRCKIEIEYEPEEIGGLLYSLKDQVMKPQLERKQGL
ncbi:MAG: relaxase/mobilization nuclease domain-containing protein [Pseudomonas sp.]|uniref:relaxase/mobilization nuclease domain-containing protein n=1 Tax=Pseudomonas sp. TaxID=306 RepID=UPI003D1482D1